MSPIKGFTKDAHRAIIAASGKFEILIYRIATDAALQRGSDVIQTCDVQSALRILADGNEQWRQALQESQKPENANRRAG